MNEKDKESITKIISAINFNESIIAKQEDAIKIAKGKISHANFRLNHLNKLLKKKQDEIRNR